MRVPVVTIGVGLLGAATLSSVGYHIGMSGPETVVAAAFGFTVGSVMSEVLAFMHVMVVAARAVTGAMLEITAVTSKLRFVPGPPPKE